MSNYSILGVVDLRRDFGDTYESETCQRCNHRLRYVHVVVDTETEEELRVGGCCAQQLIQGYHAYRHERKMINAFNRVNRIPDLQSWVESRNGNPTIFIDGWRLSVFPDFYNIARFKFCVSHDDETHWSSQNYPTIRDAQLAGGWELAERAGWLDFEDAADDSDEYDGD